MTRGIVRESQGHSRRRGKRQGENVQEKDIHVDISVSVRNKRHVVASFCINRMCELGSAEPARDSAQ